MKAKAVYVQSDPNDDGQIVHSVDHDNGGFLVSSEKVGVAIQNFLNSATAMDLYVLHGHLMYAFKDKFIEEQNDARENISHWMDAEFGKRV